MKVQIIDISKQILGEIPSPCRNCIYWEFPELFNKVKSEEAFKHKKSWFIKALNSFGVCGKILYVNDEAVAYSQFAPYHLLPQTKNYGCQLEEVRNDTVFLSCLFICKPEYRRMGLGSKLLEDILSSLRAYGFNEIETIARRGSANNPSGPLEFYLKHNFQIKKILDQNFVLVGLKL